MDLISRQDAINAFKKELTLGESKGNYVTIFSAVGYEGARQILERLPSAQLEEAISVAWLEEQAKWFESMDNAFAKIEASNIRVMIKKWRVKNEDYSI